MSRPIDDIQWGHEQGIQYIDDLSTLTNETISNRNRNIAIEQFLSSVDTNWPTNNQSLFVNQYATFYVDAGNGDDFNDGTVGSPLKTVEAALYKSKKGAETEIVLVPGTTHKVTTHISLYNPSIRFKTPWQNTGDVILEFENGSLNISHGVVEMVGSSHGTFTLIHNGGSSYFGNTILNANSSDSNFVVGGYANFTIEYKQDSSGLYGNGGFIHGVNSSLALANLSHTTSAGVDASTIIIAKSNAKGLRMAYWGQTKPTAMLYHNGTSNVINWL